MSKSKRLYRRRMMLQAWCLLLIFISAISIKSIHFHGDDGIRIANVKGSHSVSQLSTKDTCPICQFTFSNAESARNIIFCFVAFFIGIQYTTITRKAHSCCIITKKLRAPPYLPD